MTRRIAPNDVRQIGKLVFKLFVRHRNFDAANDMRRPAPYTTSQRGIVLETRRGFEETPSLLLVITTGALRSLFPVVR